MARLISSSLIVALLSSQVLSTPILYINSANSTNSTNPSNSTLPPKHEPVYRKPLGHSVALAQAPSSENATVPQAIEWSGDYIAQSFSSNNTSSNTTSINNILAPSFDNYTNGKTKRFIDGTDDRYKFDSPNYPYHSVGKLSWDNGVYCSGALIGPRHVLTAKHCYVPNTPGKFSPGFDNGERFGHADVTIAIMSTYEWGTPCGWKNDWMVLVLNKRLGDKLGYFGVKLPSKTLQDKPVFRHVGYPGDKGGNEPYRVDGNTIESYRPWDCDATGPFYTDTDCAGGQSGGPHWQPQGVAGSDGHYIWGTLSVTIDYGGGVAASGWGSGDLMLGAIRQAKRAFP